MDSKGHAKFVPCSKSISHHTAWDINYLFTAPELWYPSQMTGNIPSFKSWRSWATDVNEGMVINISQASNLVELCQFKPVENHPLIPGNVSQKYNVPSSPCCRSLKQLLHYIPKKGYSCMYFNLKVTYCLFFHSKRWLLYSNSFY